MLRRVERVDAADAQSRALLLALLATQLTWNGNIAERRILVDEAMALARQTGDPATLLRASSGFHTAMWTPDNVDEREPSPANRSRSPVSCATRSLIFSHCTALTMNVRLETARSIKDQLARCTEIAGHLGHPTMRWVARWYASVDAFPSG